MTDRELMQQALNWADNHGEVVFAGGGWHAVNPMNEWTRKIRARLAQPEPEPYCWTWDKWISGGYWEAQYGWEPYCGGKRPEHSTEAKPLYTAPPQREWMEQERAVGYREGHQAALKQREWKGLTDEEQVEIALSCGCMSADWLDFASAIEAKLKAKNEY
jgi:hypothetical protein